MGLDDALEEDVLELQRRVREECQDVCLDVPVTSLDRKLAEKVLGELAIGNVKNVDSLRWLVDYFFSCQFPFPRGLILNGENREHYHRVIRATGEVDELNRLLLIEQNPLVLRALAMFVRMYNKRIDTTPLTLEREEFDRNVFERGLRLYLQQKEFSRRVIEEDSWRGDKGIVLELARGERTKDMIRDEKERNPTKVRNYERGAARSVARFKRERVEEWLRGCPELEYYYDIPESVKDMFLQSLKRVYMSKAIENGFQRLDDVFVGFELELYLSSNGAILEGDNIGDGDNTRIRREIDGLYEEKLTHCFDEMAYGNLSLLLLGELENGVYKKRLRPVFISGNNLGVESWMTIAGLHRKFYLGKDSWRRRLRKGELWGIKEAAGKYIAEPKAGRWRVNPGSVDRFTSRYNDDGRLLIARNLEGLSRIVCEECHTLPEAAKLDGMPSLDTLRRIVKEEGLGLTALVGVPYNRRNRHGRVEPAMVVRERRVLTGEDVRMIYSAPDSGG